MRIAGVTAATLALVLSLCAFLPGTDGRLVAGSADRARALFSAPLAAAGIQLEIDVTHATLVSAWGHSVARYMLPLTAGGFTSSATRFVSERHSDQALYVIHPALAGRCLVIASAANRAVEVLGALLNDRSLAWDVALFHESAHCVRNVAADRQAALRRGDWTEEFPLENELFAGYLSEAYADAYAILAVASEEGGSDRPQRTAVAVAGWREAQRSAPSYRTRAAVLIAAQLVPERNGSSPDAWIERDVLAMRSALAGSREWLLAANIPEEHIGRSLLEYARAVAQLDAATPKVATNA